VDWSRGAEI